MCSFPLPNRNGWVCGSSLGRVGESGRDNGEKEIWRNRGCRWNVWRIIRRNEPRWKRWDELKAESDYAVKAGNGRRAVWCRPCERDGTWVFMSSYGSIWISLSHLSSKDRPSLRSSRLVMASSNKQTNKQKTNERSTRLNRRKAFWTSVQLSGFISQEPLKGSRGAL